MTNPFNFFYFVLTIKKHKKSCLCNYIAYAGYAGYAIIKLITTKSEVNESPISVLVCAYVLQNRVPTQVLKSLKPIFHSNAKPLALGILPNANPQREGFCVGNTHMFEIPTTQTLRFVIG